MTNVQRAADIVAEAEEWLDAGVTSQEAWRGHTTLETWFGWRPANAAVRSALDDLAALNRHIAAVEAFRRRGTAEEELYADYPSNDND